MNVSMLKSVADILIDIHGQNEQQSLLHKHKHMEIVDRYVGEKMCGKDVKFSKMYKEYKDMSEKYNGKEISEMSVLEKFHLLNMNWNRLRMLIL